MRCKAGGASCKCSARLFDIFFETFIRNDCDKFALETDCLMVVQGDLIINARFHMQGYA